MAELVPANDPASTLASGISAAATGLTVATGEGTGKGFSDPAGTGTGRLVLVRLSDGKKEIVSFTDRAGDTFTGLTRAAEPVRGDQTAYAFVAGDAAYEVLTNAALTALLGGGGGSTIDSTAYGSLPGSPASGEADLVSDAPYVLRYDGSLWVPWGPVFPMVVPPSGGWTLRNANGAAISANGYRDLRGSRTNGGDQNTFESRALPGAPYTLTVCFLLDQLTDGGMTGLFLYDSASGKFRQFALQGFSGAPLRYRVLYWNSFTSVSNSGVLTTNIYGPGMWGGLLWMQLVNDNTNIAWSAGPFKHKLNSLYSEAKNTFVTPDSLAWGTYTTSAGALHGATLLSWEVT